MCVVVGEQGGVGGVGVLVSQQELIGSRGGREPAPRPRSSRPHPAAVKRVCVTVEEQTGCDQMLKLVSIQFTCDQGDYFEKTLELGPV